MARTAKARSGFALVIALSLMAFVLLLILSITSFVVVEQQSANIAKQQLAAKQNALVGLQIAIGELQQHLGPDQRATASADILDSSNNPYTVVWHSDPTKGWDGATKDWITGGDAEFALPLLSVDPAKLDSLITNKKFNESVLDNPVELMAISNPSNGTLTSLKAERRPLVDAQGATTGNYAWVAQDESLKANLKTEHGDYQNKDSSLDLVETSRRLSVFPYANAAGIEIKGERPFGAIEPVVNGELNDEYFEKIQKAEDLDDLITSGLLDPADESGSKAKQLAPYRNHFTLNSKGVLADAKNGGLRRDLSRGLDDQYYEKLHGLPVFGIDTIADYSSAREALKAIAATPSLIADGITAPVGDQWKFLRDYYNFYRETDDRLANDLGDSRNTLHGLSDVTDINPTIRMRFTHTDLARGLSFMFHDANGRRYGNETPIYSSLITPLTRTEFTNPKRTGTIDGQNITNDDWFLLTPAIRPVVLRNTLKLGLSFTEITKEDKPTLRGPNNINVGKFIFSFESYPVYTIWNPFNVAIDLSPSNSQNPLAEGDFIEFEQGGNIVVQIKVNDEPKLREFALHKNIPNARIGEIGLPTYIPAGAVMVFGLSQSYKSKNINSNVTAKMAPVGTTPTVSEWNNVSYSQEEFTEVVVFDADGNPVQETEGGNLKFDEDGDPVWKTKMAYQPIIFEPTDVITLVEASDKIHFNSLEWSGKIHSDGNLFKSFYLGQNSDLPKPKYAAEDELIGEVSEIAEKGLFPLITIDFSANTTGKQGTYGYPGNNPAFPVFSQVNFLGSFPQVVAEDDTDGDVKALYHRERFHLGSDFSTIFPDNDDSGYGYFGESFRTESAKRITLYDLPRHPIVSIGDFRNLTLGWNEDTHARPVGASWPLATLRDLSNPYIRSVEPDGYGTGTRQERFNYYNNGAGCDTSYFYNNELFDKYYLSGIPAGDRNEEVDLLAQTFPYGQYFDQSYISKKLPLANSRLSYFKSPSLGQYYTDSSGSLIPEYFNASEGNFDGYLKSAAHLMIDAPFNINSTSAKAWQAVLSGFKDQAIAGVNSVSRSRLSYNESGSPFVDNFVPSGGPNNLYAGHRRLSDVQMQDLTSALVEEIMVRGVARNLGDFVNRDLSGSDSTKKKMSRIDAAIKSQELNTANNTRTSGDDRYASPDPAKIGRSARMFGNSILEDSTAGLPGYLKQQDLLRALSPIMTTRGDTFKIRAYGEVNNPTDGSIEGKAWCEVVLQRVPDYVAATMPPWEMPDDEKYRPEVRKLNTQMGRRFEVISFRWLANNEII